MQKFNEDFITIQEFDDLQNDKNYTYELIDGVVCMTPKFNLIYKNIIMNLSTEIRNYLKFKPYKVFSEVELLVNDDVLNADICIVESFDILTTKRINIVPIIVIEIITPSKTYLEIDDKIYKYKNFGVGEYWIINPKNNTLTIFSLTNNITPTFCKNGSINSNILVDFKLPLEEIFQ